VTDICPEDDAEWCIGVSISNPIIRLKRVAFKKEARKL